MSTFKFGYLCWTLKEGFIVKSDLTTSKDFQPMISYKLVSHCKPLGTIISEFVSIFKFGKPHLTLKEGSKVKSDHIKRFPAHDFL